MSSGERPIGAAKGHQTNTEALCQTPPFPRPQGLFDWWSGSCHFLSQSEDVIWTVGSSPTPPLISIMAFG